MPSPHIQPTGSRFAERPSRPSDLPTPSGDSVLEATVRLQAARDVGEFAEVFEQTLGDDRGSLARLHQFLETAACWCREHGAHHSAAELDTLALRLADLGADLQLLPDELAAESTRRQARTAVAQAAWRTSPAAAARLTTAPVTATPSPPSPAHRPIPHQR
jgi:hypothetical protein